MNEKETGHFVCYVPRKFGSEALDMIRTANSIIKEYESEGMAITLRQLYYKFVVHGLLPNSTKSYDKLGGLISDGRLAGLVSWTAIEDRGRNLMGLRTWRSPEAAIKETRASYRIDKWADQPMRPEVWVEKAALEGIVGSICNTLQVDFFSCRGYNSQSEQWRAGRRFSSYVAKGQRPVVFHLGDHDPSGIDMTRDNRNRLSMFAGVGVLVVRLALHMTQVEQYSLPPNPAKTTDSRFEDYRKLYGDESWELDALEPRVIRDLIRDAVLRIRDEGKWDAMTRQEAEDKIVLDQFAEDADGS